MSQRQLPLSELPRAVRLAGEDSQADHGAGVARAVGGVDREACGVVDEATGDARGVQPAGVQLFAKGSGIEDVDALNIMNTIGLGGTGYADATKTN